jgi:signal transduction histidine kinase
MSFTKYVAGLDVTPGLPYAPFWSAFIQLLRGSSQSSIHVSTRTTSDRFIILVDSDGPSADWGATDPSTHGHAMAQVRNACESLGGSIEIESPPGEGTRMTFAFPSQSIIYEGHTAVLPRSTRHGTSAA